MGASGGGRAGADRGHRASARAVPPGNVDQGLPAPTPRRGDGRGGSRCRRGLGRVRDRGCLFAVHDAGGARAVTSTSQSGAEDACFAGASVPSADERPRLLLGRGLDARFAAGTSGSPTLRGVLRAAARSSRRCREPRRADYDGATALRGCRGDATTSSCRSRSSGAPMHG